MLFFIKILLIFNLLFILVQDIKFRAVYWWLFPLLLILCLGYNYWSHDHFLLHNIGYNLVFLIIVFSSLTLYFSVKNGRIVSLNKDYLGLGDILFLVAISAIFSPFNFCLFVVFSSMLVLIIALIYPSWRNNIPLAGLQALFLCLILLFDQHIIQISSDQWIMYQLISC
jgi:hypothetical protein